MTLDTRRCMTLFADANSSSCIASLTITGFRVVPVEECWHKSLTPLMRIVRDRIGDAPVYLSYDIDSLDPAFAVDRSRTATTSPGSIRLRTAEDPRTRTSTGIAARTLCVTTQNASN